MKIREKTNLDICNDNDLKLAILTNVVEEKKKLIMACKTMKEFDDIRDQERPRNQSSRPK